LTPIWRRGERLILNVGGRVASTDEEEGGCGAQRDDAEQSRQAPARPMLPRPPRLRCGLRLLRILRPNDDLNLHLPIVHGLPASLFSLVREGRGA
jgi:hypothetical protein